MRFAYLLALMVACKKAEPPPPTIAPPTEVRDAAIALVDATTATSDAVGASQIVDVELVQRTAASVRVSSKVANPNIKPAHLVDKNMATAWNSVTGELVGAWIEIRPIAGAQIHEVRMTAGFTAKGPKGEDWFTMNPRIRKLTVIADGAPQPDFFLDTDQRTLQSYSVTATESVRLAVSEIVPGSKKSWREISVSELEVWGVPPAGWVSPRPLPSIDVAVGELDAPAGFQPCADIEERRAAWEAKYKDYKCDHLGCEDHDYAPLCDLETPTIVGDPLEPPWETSTAWCESQDEIYGPSSCTVRFAHGAEDTITGRESAQGRPAMSIELEMREVIAQSPGREVVVTISDGADDVRIAICRADSFTCSEMIEVPTGGKLSTQPWVFK